MVALVEGQQYGLSSLLYTDGNKTAVQVKLTDTALRVIDDFLSIQHNTSRRPKVQFHGKQGVIQFPTKKSSSDPEGWKTFSFSLASIVGDPNGSFECIQQQQYGHRAGQSDLKVVGSMPHKMTVHATDDVYNATKERVKHAEEESKKSSAVEIKPGGKYIGRRIKRVLKPGDIPKPTPPSAVRDRDPSSMNSSPSVGSMPSMAPKRVSVNPKPPGSKPLSVSQESKNPSFNEGIPCRQRTRPGSPVTQGKERSGNPEIMKKPLRDRIIHLLAIRPYKKPEIMYRLQRDGFREKDRNQIGNVLSQVGHFHIKDNSYTLQRNLYSDVNPNWPGYKDEDKNLLKQRLSSIERGMSTTPSPAISPVHSNENSNSSPPQKRSGEDIIEPVPKKQRIAHTQKIEEDHNSHNQENTVRREADSSVFYPIKKEPSPLNSNQENQYPTKVVKDEACTSNNMETDNNETGGDSEPEFATAYGLIKSEEQRIKYKADFNTEYAEYRQIHCKLEEKTHIFRDLKEKLRLEQQRGQDENIEDIKNKIFTEYKQLRRNQKYLEQRKRCDFLHKKLAHIKKLITSYDVQSVR